MFVALSIYLYIAGFFLIIGVERAAFKAVTQKEPKDYTAKEFRRASIWPLTVLSGILDAVRELITEGDAK